MPSLLFFLDKYLFSGIISDAAWDAIKAAWEKINERNWEELYLDAFREAVEHERSRLERYAASDGEISLDQAALLRALRGDLRVSVSRLSISELESDEFVTLVTQALSRHEGLIIGGHNLDEGDYLQLVHNCVRQATGIFRRSVLKQTTAFRQALIAESRSNYETLQEIITYLSDRFDLVLGTLESINETVVQVDERTHRMDSKLDTVLQRLPANDAKTQFKVDSVSSNGDATETVSLPDTLQTVKDVMVRTLVQLRELVPPLLPAHFTQIRLELDNVGDKLRKFRRSRYPLQIRARIVSLIDPVGSSEAANLVNVRISARQLEQLLSHPYDEERVAYLVGCLQSNIEAVIEEMDQISKLVL